MRIQGTCTPKNAIAKTRYLPQLILLPRVLRGSSGPDVPLPQPPVDRITSNRCEKPRTDVPLVRDQKFSDFGFHISSKFLGKGDFESQTRISDL